MDFNSILLYYKDVLVKPNELIKTIDQLGMQCDNEDLSYFALNYKTFAFCSSAMGSFTQKLYALLM